MAHETRAKTVLELASITLEQNRVRQELKMATGGFHETEGRAIAPLRAAIRRAEELKLPADVLAPARTALAEEERRSQVMAAELAAATAGDNPEELRAALRRCAEVGPDPDGTLGRRVARARAALRRMLVLQQAVPIKCADPKTAKPLESRRAAKRLRPSDLEFWSPCHKRPAEMSKMVAGSVEHAPISKLWCGQGPGLCVEPCHSIFFGVSPSTEQQTLRSLKLTNASGTRIAFKVKLTCREFYLVLPRCCGTLCPGEVRELQLALKPNWQEMPSGSRRLMVHEMQVGPEEEVPRGAWSYMRERITQHKVRISFGDETGSRSRSRSACGYEPDNLD